MTLDDAFAALAAAAQQVPKPLRLPTPEELSAAERDLGLPFHADYRRFQREASNIVCNVLEPGLVLPGLSPYRDLRRIARNGWAAGVPKDTLPFCSDNGNYYIIDGSGRVTFWDHDDGSESGQNLSLAEWIVEEWIGDDHED